MTKEKSLLFVLLISAFAPSAMADTGVQVSGTLHAASHFLWRGATLSANDPSIGGSVTVAKDGFYGTYDLHTVNLGADTNNGQHQQLNLLIGGYNGAVGNVSLSGGVIRYQFSGSAHVTDLSITELFGYAAWSGLKFTLYRNVDGAKGTVPRLDSNDTYAELAYTHAFGKFSVGGDVGYYWYSDSSAKDDVAEIALRGGYAVSEHLNVGAAYLLGGKKPNGDSWNTTKFVVSMQYVF